MTQFRCAQCGGYNPIKRNDRTRFDDRLTNLHGMKCDGCMKWFSSGTLVRQNRKSIRWWQLESGSPGTLEDDPDGAYSVWTN